MFTKFLTQCTLSRTLNITTFAHLCTRSQPFYMWVLFYPTGMAAGGCMCLSACFLFVCRWGEGGWGLGTGEINQCLAGKQPPFYPPPVFTLHHPHPQSSCLWSIYCAMMHLQLWQGMQHPNKTQGWETLLRSSISTQLNETLFITDWSWTIKDCLKCWSQMLVYEDFHSRIHVAFLTNHFLLLLCIWLVLCACVITCMCL